MGIIEIVLLGVGLAMDAFAVSICKGLSMSRINKKQALVIAGFFGGFQFLMPVLGWALGSTFAERIEKVDHWVAFLLLLYIGGKMIADAIKERKESFDNVEMDQPLDYKELFLMAIATSIDALAVGITFSFLSVNVWSASAIIGVVTFFICVIGVCIGNVFGARYKTPSQIVGGIILVCLGLKILLEHTLGL